jgi:hypothetical protein
VPFIDPTLPRRSCGTFPAPYVITALIVVMCFVVVLVHGGISPREAGALAATLLLTVTCATGWSPVRLLPRTIS